MKMTSIEKVNHKGKQKQKQKKTKKQKNETKQKQKERLGTKSQLHKPNKQFIIKLTSNNIQIHKLSVTGKS